MTTPWTPGDGGADDKRHAPATLRNRDAIVAGLKQSASRIHELTALVESADGEGMRKFFERASQARNAWGKQQG